MVILVSTVQQKLTYINSGWCVEDQPRTRGDREVGVKDIQGNPCYQHDLVIHIYIQSIYIQNNLVNVCMKILNTHTNMFMSVWFGLFFFV